MPEWIKVYEVKVYGKRPVKSLFHNPSIMIDELTRSPLSPPLPSIQLPWLSPDCLSHQSAGIRSR